jgi:hypothetical protein
MDQPIHDHMNLQEIDVRGDDFRRLGITALHFGFLQVA